MVAQRITVNRIACDGHGLCAGVLPEMIKLDDWVYPIIEARDVPRELMEHARRAVDSCPMLALHLEDRR